MVLQSGGEEEEGVFEDRMFHEGKVDKWDTSLRER